MRLRRRLWAWFGANNVLDHRVPDLTFPRIPTGTHGIPWDLKLLLYRGAAAVDRRKVAPMIEQGAFGQILVERLPLIERLHGIIEAKLVRGGEGAISSVHGQLGVLHRFVAWIDDRQTTLNLETLHGLFLAWVEGMIHRYRIKKDLQHATAYGYACNLADLVARALDYTHSEPGRSLLSQTRMRAPRHGRLGTQADKEALDRTFAFGHLLADVCGGLTAGTVRGPLPVTITLRDGNSALIKGELKFFDIDPATIRGARDRERAIQIRAPLAPDASAMLARPSVINVRIVAELLTFIAQTGMNVKQAAGLRREQYRWQTDGDEAIAYRVYKGRRGGDAIFRCFKAYRPYLEAYLAWLKELGLAATDDRLFPFIYHTGKIPAEHKLPLFTAIQGLCAQVGITYVKPQQLRKTRVNWLLRYSRDPDLTAVQAAHTKEVLLRVYAQPHHQLAAVEILRFHQKTDPTLAPPGPGICANVGRRPEAIEGAPSEAPEPDCISPEGCLFCIYHRDVMTSEYCWKLASHARLKILEVSRYKPPKSQPAHPAHAVIDRIEAKLRAISEGSDIRAMWVRDARDAIRERRYHPLWDGHIRLQETLSESA